MERLKRRDHIAYVRFASVYRNFQDLTEFYEELKELDARSAQHELLRYQRELPLEPDASGTPVPAESDESVEAAVAGTPAPAAATHTAADRS